MEGSEIKASDLGFWDSCWTAAGRPSGGYWMVIGRPTTVRQLSVFPGAGLWGREIPGPGGGSGGQELPNRWALGGKVLWGLQGNPRAPHGTLGGPMGLGGVQRAPRGSQGPPPPSCGGSKRTVHLGGPKGTQSRTHSTTQKKCCCTVYGFLYSSTFSTKPMLFSSF